MDTQKDQVVERLKQATNILVAVSANPSVDQLAGAIGLTVLLNKLNKHATAVFSGNVPSTLEFLQPDKTLEKNTDSLRDFIIALDKSKADKLRYKVEDQMVKIFITPYMTSISDKDLEFSQGDFNVEVVLALGVKEQQDLDQAITSHGRILHDATVIGISAGEATALGSINWNDPAASSLCEMLTQIGLALKADVLDGQMATALLTGIVSETSRFSNEKTSSETMQMSAKLMAAGANQQLVASQLQPPPPPPPDEVESEDLQLPEINEETDQPSDESGPPEEPETPKTTDGTLQINHGNPEESEETEPDADADAEPPSDEPEEPPVDQIHIDEEGTLKPIDDAEAPVSDQGKDSEGSARFIKEPPALGGTLTANSEPEELDSGTDILGTTNNQGPMLSHSNDTPVTKTVPQTVPLPSLTPSDPVPAAELYKPPLPPASPLPPPPPAGPHPQTLSELESLVTEGHAPKPEGDADTQPTATASPEPGTDVNDARDAVSQAMTGTTPQILEPVKSLNAQPMDLNLGDMPAVSTSLASAFASNSSAPSLDNPPAANPVTPPPLVPVDTEDDSASPTPAPTDDAAGSVTDPNAPPPVPPPMMPPGQFTP